MAYCRWGDDSDAYVWEDRSGKWAVWMCKSEHYPEGVKFMEPTPFEAAHRLREMMKLGYKVRASAIAALEEEAVGRVKGILDGPASEWLEFYGNGGTTVIRRDQIAAFYPSADSSKGAYICLVDGRTLKVDDSVLDISRMLGLESWRLDLDGFTDWVAEFAPGAEVVMGPPTARDANGNAYVTYAGEGPKPEGAAAPGYETREQAIAALKDTLHEHCAGAKRAIVRVLPEVTPGQDFDPVTMKYVGPVKWWPRARLFIEK